MLKRILVLLVAVGLVLAPAACSPAGPASALQKVTIAHGGSVIPVEHPGQYLPVKLGFYKDEGLEVTVQAAGGSQQALQLLAAGQVQFIQVNPETVINGREQGVPVVAVYSVVTHHNARLAVLASSPIQKVSDLKGKKIGVPSQASGNVPYAKALLKEAGLDPDKDVEMLPTGFGAEAGEALKSGKVDALSYWTGFFAGLENQGLQFRFFAWDKVKAAPGHVLATTEDVIKKDPKLVEKVGRAMAKAAVYAYAKPEDAVKAFWGVYPDAKPKDVAEAAALKSAVHVLQVQLEDMRVDNRSDTRWGWNDAAGWKGLQSYMLSAGLQKTEILEQNLYTNDFVKGFNDFDANKVKNLAGS